MRRFGRWAFHILAGFSLVLCAAFSTLWLRSYDIKDIWGWWQTSDDGTNKTSGWTGLHSECGGIGAGQIKSIVAKGNPAEGRMKELFPTIGAVSAFLLSGHQMSHFGQISAWRRFVGLGSAF